MKIAIQTSAAFEERPLELLYACHEKVRRFTGLTERLVAHAAARGADAEAREAAASVLRYFEQALPLHHADEEADVFPALRALHDTALSAAIAALEDEHAALDAQWQRVAPWLRQLAAGAAAAAADFAPTQQEVADFAAAYVRHIECEEGEVFVAIERLPEAVVHAVAARMRARRGA